MSSLGETGSLQLFRFNSMLTAYDWDTLNSIHKDAYAGRLEDLCRDRPTDLITALKSRSYNDVYLWAHLSNAIQKCNASEISRLIDLGLGRTLAAKILDDSIPVDAIDIWVSSHSLYSTYPLLALSMVSLIGKSILAWTSLCTQSHCSCRHGTGHRKEHCASFPTGSGVHNSPEISSSG